MDIQHNTTIYIFSVEVNDQTEDMCTLQPFKYLMIWHKYDTHVASLYFYMINICDVIFHQTLCFEIFFVYLPVFTNTYHDRISMMNVYFYHKRNIHNHTLPCNVQAFVLIEVVKVNGM